MEQVKRIIALLLLVVGIFVPRLQAQELNVTVQVITQQVQNVDKKIFETMKLSMQEFLNNTKWTQDQFNNNEKIEATLLINIKEVVSQTDFKATCQLETRRPVYKSSYNSTIVSYLDESFDFKYVEFQPFEFNGNTFANELTALCAYYAYIIIGFDYDTFSLKGGTTFFQSAQNVVNNAQNYGSKGWSSMAKGGDKYNNRYWLVENTLNPAYTPIREAYYLYHRKGMDRMYSSPEEGRKEVFTALQDIEKVFKTYPTLFFNILFFNAKSDEIINVYSQATSEEKQKVVELLSVIDAAKSNKYQTRIK